MNEFYSLGLRSGVWSGKLVADAEPGRVVLVHLGQIVARARISESRPGEWLVQTDLPASVLADGTHTLLLMADDGPDDAPLIPVSATRLAALPIIAGEPLDDDLRAEMDLMRAELDLLKSELRRLAQRV